jgi:DNA-binding transcriptional LysR family regulator
MNNVVQKNSNSVAWDDVQAIHAVAQAKSIRKAAERLGLAHTTLARRIEMAEQRLGVVAFVRSATGYVLTEAGQNIVSHAVTMAEAADALALNIASGDMEPSGRVRISLPPSLLTYCLAEPLTKLQGDFPGISLDIDSRYSYSNLNRHDADIAIRYQKDPDPQLVGVCAGVSRECAYATLANVKAWKDGTPVGVVGWSRSDAFRKRLSEVGLDGVDIVATCTDVHGQVAMAEQGIGIAVIPRIVGDRTKLQRLHKDRTTTGSPVWVLTHANLQRSARIKTVTGFLSKTLKKQLSD